MKKNKDYFDITLTILTIALLGAFAIRPVLITTITLNNDIAKYEKLRTGLINNLMKTPQMSTTLQKITPKTEILDKVIPNTPKEENLLKIINEKARINIVTLESISYEFDKTKNNPKSISIKLVANGDYANLKAFIKDITNSTRLISIESIGLTETNDTTTKKTFVTLDLSAKAYYSLQTDHD